MKNKKGKVTLVGFGPGNPDLLTVGGLKALEQADVIFYDNLIDQNYIQQFEAEKIYVGKRRHRHSCKQSNIHWLLLTAANEGKSVVRLKGGDPMIFAHGGEEVHYLEDNGIEVKVIPGISAGIGLSACTKIPLTHRGLSRSVSFITGHNEEIIMPDTETVVIYMGGATIHKLAKHAIDAGKASNTPVALIYNVSMPDQKEYISTLGDLAVGKEIYPTPVIIIVGEVVKLYRNNGANHQLTENILQQEFSA